MSNRPEPRLCERCGARLAADNRDALCSPCLRAVIPAGGVIAAPPVTFWDSPQLRVVLAERDFGKVLRAFRQAVQPQVKQAELAAWLGITQSQISRIERGSTVVRDLDKLDRWSRIIGIPQRCLWFSLSPQSSDAYQQATNTFSVDSEADTEGDAVRRRQFIKASSVGAAVSVGATLLATRSGKTWGKVSSAVGNPEVDLVREVTVAFRKVDNKYGGGHSRSAVTSYLTTTVEPLLKNGRMRTPIRKELFTAAAELQQLAGWMAYDTGQSDAGRIHLRTALRLCQEVNDDALGAEMLAGMSHQAAFHGSIDFAVDLALASRQAARRTGISALQAEGAVMEAHALALHGDKVGCLAALRDAEALSSSIEGSNLPAWLRYFDTAYLAAKFAHTFHDLGSPRDAEQFARRSLEMTDGYERGRLFNTALLATILADMGRVEEACAYGSIAVGMTDSVRSVRGMSYLTNLTNALAAHRDSSAVQGFYERILDIGIAVPSDG